jgi:hypothetical protein
MRAHRGKSILGEKERWWTHVRRAYRSAIRSYLKLADGVAFLIAAIRRNWTFTLCDCRVVNGMVDAEVWRSVLVGKEG